MNEVTKINKTSILVFVFSLNIIIIITMWFVVFGENLFIADRVVDFCYFVFIVNIVISVGFILIVLLFLIRKRVIGGEKYYHKKESPSKNAIIPEKYTNEQVGNDVQKNEKISFLDFFKDSENMIMVFKIFLVFLGIFLAIFIFRMIS